MKGGGATALERIILGIDPGTIVMGYGVLSINGRKAALETMGVLKLDRYEDHYVRLRRIYDRSAFFREEYTKYVEAGTCTGGCHCRSVKS